MNRFTFRLMSNRRSDALDFLFTEAIRVGFKKLDAGDHYSLLTLKNDYTILYWNANYPYAWLSGGEVKDINGKVTYSWKDRRPSRKVMAEFEDAVNSINPFG